MKANRSVLVLGGGIAGISAGFHSKSNGFDSLVYEASDSPGGLTANFSVNGFRFDKAIHMSFSKDQYVREVFDKTPYFAHKPDAFCLEDNRWLKHPIQNNLFNLPVPEKVSLIESFISRPNSEPTNYKEWLIYQYGKKITERYPLIYTNKYWGLPPENLSLNWIGDRMRKANTVEVLEGAMQPKDDNHYYTSEMRYPKKGGYYEFIREMAELTNIKCNKKVTKINCKENIVECEDGSVTNYESLISSLPLPIICQLIEDCPQKVKETADTLLWTTVDLISFGFNKEDIPPYLWFYIYDEDNLAARGYSPSLKAPSNAPKGCSSLQFEVYNLSSKPNYDPEELKKNITKKLLEMNVCKKEDILFSHHKHLPFGNIVFDHGMEERRKIVLDYLKKVNIHSCGRFGEWEYFWSDQSFLSGKSAADKILS